MDTGMVPPTVHISVPSNGETLVAGEQLEIEVKATDDAGIVGQVVTTAGNLVAGAVADHAGNSNSVAPGSGCDRRPTGGHHWH